MFLLYDTHVLYILVVLIYKPETKLGNKMVMLDDDPMITKFSDLFQLKADNSNCSVCEKKMGNVNLLSGRGIEHKCPVKTTPSKSKANSKICLGITFAVTCYITKNQIFFLR